MNLYILVEGRRTEMAVYPAWLSILIPEMQRIYRPFEVTENNYYIVSGFGFPNLLGHISNCSHDINRYPAFDYLVICLDSDDFSVAHRIREIEQLLNNGNWPIDGKVKVIVQKKCIETWFLGSDTYYDSASDSRLSQFFNYYDISKNDPEKMDKPYNYHGSIGDYHVNYLVSLLESKGKFYSKRNPQVVCTGEYLESLRRRVSSTKHLLTLKNFFDFAEFIKNSPPIKRPEPPAQIVDDSIKKAPNAYKKTDEVEIVSTPAVSDYEIITHEPPDIPPQKNNRR